MEGRMRWFWERRTEPYRYLQKPQEVTREHAQALYRETAHGVMGNLIACENMHKGVYKQGLHFAIWGERVTDKDLFQRILKGTVQPGIREL